MSSRIYLPGQHSAVYLIHFDQPLGNEQHQARHYIGYCAHYMGLQRRLKQHRAGKGAAITRACVERGISFDIVDWWRAPRSLERKLKNQKNAARLCPVCQAERQAARLRGTALQLDFFAELEGYIPF